MQQAAILHLVRAQSLTMDIGPWTRGRGSIDAYVENLLQPVLTFYSLPTLLPGARPRHVRPAGRLQRPQRRCTLAS
eukprot:scaffold94990_cov58-Phaeocystis_antarctica.AAC.3